MALGGPLAGSDALLTLGTGGWYNPAWWSEHRLGYLGATAARRRRARDEPKGSEGELSGEERRAGSPAPLPSGAYRVCLGGQQSKFAQASFGRDIAGGLVLLTASAGLT